MKAISHRRVSRYCDLPSGFTFDWRVFRFESLSFGSRRVGYAVLGFFLLKTVDGGETWCCRRHVAPEGFAPRGIFALGRMRCWVACASSTGGCQGPIPLLATEDGGKRWEVCWAGNRAARYASKSHLFFVDERAGWLAATQYTEHGQRGVLFRTTDGGAQWRPTQESLDFSPQGLFFANINEGYLLGAFSEQDRKRAFRVELTNGSSRTGFWVGGHPTALFRLTEGGALLEPVVQSKSSLFAMGAAGSASIIMCGANGSLIRWDKDENVWQRVKSGTRSDLNDIGFAKQGSRSGGLAVGEDGAILGSADGGKTWRRLHHTIGRGSFFRVQMAGVSTGVVAASDALYLISVVE